MKYNCIVFKISDNLKNKLIKFYEKFYCDKKPPYSVFQAKTYDVTITFYESGKVMFQGIGADIEASVWIEAEKKLNNRVIEINNDKKKKKSYEDSIFFNCDTIGSDETGCGDFFGPIVVVATYVTKANISYLRTLGCRDSKALTDEKIIKIAPEIMKNIPYECIILNNNSYNGEYKEANMVQIKCILHNKALVGLVNKCNPKYDYAVMDQFVNGRKYYEYVKDIPDKLDNISFHTKGETKCMSVAAASVIARYVFLDEMAKLDKKVGIHLQKGAGESVDAQIQELIAKYGKEYLKGISKLDFNNFRKIN